MEDHPKRADAWEDLSPEQQEEMSPEFWASLSNEERQARLEFPTDDISAAALEQYVPDAAVDPPAEDFDNGQE